MLAVFYLDHFELTTPSQVLVEKHPVTWIKVMGRAHRVHLPGSLRACIPQMAVTPQ